MFKTNDIFNTARNHNITVGTFVINSDVDTSVFTSIMDALYIRWGNNHTFEVVRNFDTVNNTNTYKIVWTPKLNISPSEFERLGCAIAAYIMGFHDSQTNKWNN